MQKEYIDATVKEAWLRTYIIRENECEISIWVPKEHQRKGIGTGLLTQVTNDADEEGVTLYADPEPPCYNENDRTGLIKLYKRFGFEFPNIGGDEWGRWMIRKPYKKPS